MSDVIEIELPRGTDPKQAELLVGELRKLTEVQSTDVVRPKAIDPVSLIVWVKLAAAAMPVLTSLVGLIRGRKLEKVRIKVGDATIEVDSASAKDLQSLIESVHKDD